MYYKFIRYIFIYSIFFFFALHNLSAQPCADTRPVISGAQAVTDGQSQVVYSTPAIPGHTYSWTITNGTINSGAGTNQVSVTWNNVGPGSIQVTETNTALGCSTVSTKNVLVQPLLVSYFYYTNTSCYGDVLTFHDTSFADPAKPIVAWEWNFGDGQTSTAQNPNHIYLPPYNQTWTVTLIVTNNDGYKDTIYDAVYVNPDQYIPHPDFLANIPACSYDPVTFDGSISTTPAGTLPWTRFIWDYGDAASSHSKDTLTTTTTSHIFSAPGTYNVKLTVINKQYCQNTITKQIVIQPSVPDARFTYSTPTCVNNPVTLDATGSTAPGAHNIVSYSWNFGDASAPLVQTPPVAPFAHTFPALGPYPVNLIVTTETGCKDTVVIPVSLTPSPIAKFTNSSNCLGVPVQFTSQSHPNSGPPLASYLWDFDDPTSVGNVMTVPNPTHTFSGTGTYNVSLIVHNDANCVDTFTKAITIYPPPPVEFTWNFGSQNNLVYFHIDPTIVPIGMVGNMIHWDFGDGTFGNGFDPSHVYPTSSNYDVTVTVTDTIGCSNSITHQIYVPSVPLALFSSNSPVCFKQCVQFIDASSASVGPPFGWVDTWIWDYGDGTRDTIHFANFYNPCHTYAVADTFRVTLTIIDNNGFTDDYPRDVIVMPNPKANFYATGECAQQDITFHDISSAMGAGNIVSWKWDFADPASGTANVSFLTNPVHSFTTGGTFNVRLIVENFNGCVDTIIKPVNVRFAPTVDFVYDTVCLNDLVHLSADTLVTFADSIATWQWNFGDGSPLLLGSSSTSHLYTTAGTFTVSLTVTDIHGCINKITHDVKVNPLPVPLFSWSTPACQETALTFTNNSYIPPSFTGFIAKTTWDFGDGSPLETYIHPNFPPVVHTFPTTSWSYPVTLTVWSNDSCFQSITRTVTIQPAPVANFNFSSVNCTGQAVNFTNISDANGGGNIVGFAWNFGDPISGSNNLSINENPTHTFINAGIYDVRLIVTNVNGCVDTVTHQVTIANGPLASFVADTVCQNSAMTFTFSGDPNINSFLWDFGDGGNSAQQNPQHTYLNPGTYHVTLHVTNTAGCSKDTSRYVLVNPLPIPAFSSSSPNCLGASVQFFNTSTTVPGFVGPITQWVWDFGDGNTQTITTGNPNVTHSYAGPGTSYNVTLTVTTSNGCSASITHVVNNVPSPTADFSYTGTSCAMQGVNFTDLSQTGTGNIVSWLWNFGDPLSGGNNTSVAQSPVHFFSGQGNFQVQLIVTNSSNCTDTITHQVTIAPKPTANFSADTACLNSLTTFADQSPTGQGVSMWSWDFGDGGTSNIQNPTHLYVAAGVYPVTLTVTTGAGCFNTTTKNVLVVTKPTAAFSTSAPACQSDSIAFQDASNAGYGLIQTWLWDFGDGNTVTRTTPQSPNVKHRYTTSGTFNVKLKITTQNGCEAEKIIPVNVQPAPFANFDYGTVHCEGFGLDFHDISQLNGGSPITQWDWNFDDPGSGSLNTSNLQNPIHEFSAAGTFTVRLIVTNAAGCVSRDSADIVINAKPLAQFENDTACIGSNTQFTDQSTAATGTINTWSWDFGDPASGSNNYSTNQNPTHSYASPGNYNVTLTVTTSMGCPSDTTVIVAVNPKPSALFEYSSSCINSETQFTDLSIAPGSSVTSWSWDFGDNSGTSTLQNPVYTYTTAGTYNVKLKVTNLSNCTDSVTIAVVARQTPTAQYTYTSFFCPSGQVNFEDQSQGAGSAIVDRFWTFEPGYNSTLPNPVHVFTTPGQDYPVTLVVTDNYGCKDTIVDTIPVKPGFAFEFNNDTVCFGTPTHFTPVNLATGDSLYSVKWNFGDPASGPSNTSYTYNGVHTYTAPGDYYVMMKASNSDNCTDSVFKTITVHALPQPTYVFTSTPCDSVIRFNESSLPGSGGISSWEWDFGDGSTPIVIPAPGSGDTSHLYTALGTYDVILKVTNSYGCTDTVKHTAELYPCINANFTHGDTLLCARYPILFSDSSLPTDRINQWHWIFDDGQDTTYTSHTGSIIHSYDLPGTYNVKLIINATVSDVNFTDSLMQTVVINPTPLPGFVTNATCYKQPNMFHDTSWNYGEPVSSWTWYFGDPGSGASDTSHLTNPRHDYDSAYTYNVQLLVMNRFGCKDSITKTAKVMAIPEAHFQSTLACQSNPTIFNNRTIEGDTTLNMWHWNFGDLNTKKDTSMIENPNYSYKQPGDYMVRLVVRDYNGCYDTVDSTVTVLLSPMSSFNVTDNVEGVPGKVLFNNLSTGADVFFWDFGNGHTSVDENPIVSYSEDGTYLVMLVSRNQNECTDTSYYKYEVLFRGLFVPNAFAPSSNTLSARLFQPKGTNLKSYKITVFDEWGHEVWTSEKLDLQGHPAEGWDGRDANGNLLPMGTYMWKANATFIDGSEWQGSDIGKGEPSTVGTVSLIR